MTFEFAGCGRMETDMEKITESNAVYDTNNKIMNADATNQMMDSGSKEDTEFMVLEIEACTKSRR